MSPNSFVVVWLWLSNTRLVAFGMNFLQPSPCLPPYGSLPVILLVKTLLFLFSFSKKSLPQHRHFFLIFPKLFSVFVVKKKNKNPSFFVELCWSCSRGRFHKYFLSPKERCLKQNNFTVVYTCKATLGQGVFGMSLRTIAHLTPHSTCNYLYLQVLLFV